MDNHKYHLLITEKLKLRLNNIKGLDKYSFSGRIILVLNKFDKLSKYSKYFDIDEESKVEYLETRKNIHLYMKKSLYKKLKYFHARFDTYSIAQLVRKTIRIFLEMVDKYGFEEAFKRISNENRKLKQVIKFNKKSKIRVQLYRYLGLEITDTLKFEIFLIKLLL